MKNKRTLKTLIASTVLAGSLMMPMASPVQAWEYPTVEQRQSWPMPTGRTCYNKELVTLAYYAGWEPKDIPRVMRIMYGESRCKPNARSRTRDSGLMQINDINLKWLHTTSAALMDPFTNLYAAHLVFVRQGWRAWHTPLNR
jgi:hypothetical protein